MCDNQGCIANLNNPIISDRTKHIDIAHRFATERVEMGDVSFVYCPTSQMVADALTKPVPIPALQFFRSSIGLR